DLETAPDALLYQVTSSNPTLVGSNAVFSGQGSFRTLTLTPAAERTGSANLLLSITDEGGATVSTSFRLSVNAANDPPTLDSLPDLVLDEDAGPQTISLSGISS